MSQIIILRKWNDQYWLMLVSFMLRLDHRSSGRASASCHLSARDDGRWDICWKLSTILSRHHSGWVGQSQPLGMCYRGIKLEVSWSQDPKDMQNSLVGLNSISLLWAIHEMFSRKMVVFLLSEVTWEFLLGARIYTNHHTFGLSLILLFLNIAFTLSDFYKVWWK